MKYRPEIDGLRALAVVPVILFHAHLPGFSGGYVGVDVFFVISGYLITTILIGEIQEQQFSIINFYERRLRRILPALATVIFISYPFAYFLLLPSEFLDFSQSILAVTVFASNILFFLESDYFATASELKPLLHTWSLAIEEQYYLFFPIFLVVFWRFGKTIVLGILCIVFIISIALSVWASTQFPSANFYLLPSRVWELLVGSILAFWICYRGYAKTKLFNEIFSIFGLLAILFSVFFFDKNTPFPSAYALLPTLGAACLILFAVDNTLVQSLLRWRILVYLGLISYSLYLWHQPVFAFAKQYAFFELPSNLTMLMLSLLVLPLSHLTWKFVETPFRSKSAFNRAKIFKWSAGTSIIMVILGFSGLHLSNYKASPMFLSEYNIAEFNLDNVSLREATWQPLRQLAEDDSYQVDNNTFDQSLWFDTEDKRRKILVIGNSHSKDLYNVLSYSKTVTEHFQLARYGEQIHKLDHRLFTLANYINADIIMLASQYRKNDLSKLSWLIEGLKRDNKQLAIVKNISEFESFYIRNLTLADKIVETSIKSGVSDIQEITQAANKAYTEVISNQKIPQRIVLANEQIDALKNQFPHIIILDRDAYMCEPDHKKCYAMDMKLNKYFYDSSHHTLEGAAFYGKRIDQINWLGELLEQK